MGGASLKRSSNTPSADSPTIFEWMPHVSEFYGIVIAMYYRGVPHFHASYAGHAASIAIDTLEPIGGSLPARALRLVREWGEAHRADLAANWDRARADEPLERIEPLA